MLIKAGADVNEWDEDESPLHSAAKSDQEKNIHFLIEQGAEIDANGTYGTALLQAVMVEKLKGVKALLSAGSNPNLPDDDDGNYPLHFAVLNKNLALVKALVNAGANPKAKNKSGQSVVDLAKAIKNKPIENFLKKSFD